MGVAGYLVLPALTVVAWGVTWLRFQRVPGLFWAGGGLGVVGCLALALLVDRMFPVNGGTVLSGLDSKGFPIFMNGVTAVPALLLLLALTLVLRLLLRVGR